MRLSRVRAVGLATLLLAGQAAQGEASPTCPERSPKLLRAVEVFDGAPEEEAMLVPDAGDARSASWQLAYLYDAGRFVTLRCRYSDDQFRDVRLSTPVAECRYRIGAKRVLNLSCH